MGKLNIGNLEFRYADAENLEFSPNSFDRIYCSSAFFWMSHPLATLRHWYELLKPNGQLGFNATPANSFLSREAIPGNTTCQSPLNAPFYHQNCRFKLKYRPNF